MADRHDRPDDELLVAAAAALRASPIATDESDALAAATAALREVEAAPPPAVAATRVRVMASLERRGRGRRKRVIVAAVMASLGTGTLSWAAATGRLQRAIAAVTEPTPAWPTDAVGPAEPEKLAAASKHRGHGGRDGDGAIAIDPEPTSAMLIATAPGADPAVSRSVSVPGAGAVPAAGAVPVPVSGAVPVPVPVPAPGAVPAGGADATFLTTTTPDPIPVPVGTAEPESETETPAVPAVPVTPPRPPRHRPAPAPAPEIVDDAVDRDLYRCAHELHFHGTDPAAALAAWDRYLSERPAGQFAIEARYNRAIALIRLGRRDDARAALAPFAGGTVEPAGYRQRDARELLAALDRDPPAETR